MPPHLATHSTVQTVATHPAAVPDTGRPGENQSTPRSGAVRLPTGVETQSNLLIAIIRFNTHFVPSDLIWCPVRLWD